MKNDILYSVKAQPRPTLRCKGWKQESLLRMLGEQHGERRETGAGWSSTAASASARATGESYHAIVDALLIWRMTRRW